MTDPELESVPTDSPRGGFVSFWGTLPGVLTGLAGLVTAVGSALFLTSGDEPTAVSHPPQVSVVSEQAPQPSQVPVYVPVVVEPDTLRNIGTVTPFSSSEPAVTDPLDACAQGDPAACGQLLEELSLMCLEDPAPCDILYEVTPLDSALEDYGATCGYRLEDWSYAGECYLL